LQEDVGRQHAEGGGEVMNQARRQGIKEGKYQALKVSRRHTANVATGDLVER